MKFRQLGKNGITVSEIGLGCWQLGNDWGDDLEEELAFAIMQAAVDNGVTFFDTADVYGSGRSERLIGQFLNTSGADIKVATKYGRLNVYPDKYSKETLLQHVTASLERLQMDQLDLLQLHCIPRSVMEEGDIFDWLRELQAEGVIKHFGASVESVDEGLLCAKQDGLQSLQIIFNVLRQKPLEQLLPECLFKNIGVIVRLPLASGLLAGHYTPDTTFPENDHRNFNKDGDYFNVGETFAGLRFQKGLDITNELKNHCPAEMTMAAFSLRWILDHDAVTTVIPGASKIEQVLSNVKPSNYQYLGDDLHQTLRSMYASSIHEHIRGVY